jgi:hypothetical protein
MWGCCARYGVSSSRRGINRLSLIFIHGTQYQIGDDPDRSVFSRHAGTGCDFFSRLVVFRARSKSTHPVGIPPLNSCIWSRGADIYRNIGGSLRPSQHPFNIIEVMISTAN